MGETINGVYYYGVNARRKRALDRLQIAKKEKAFYRSQLIDLNDGKLIVFDSKHKEKANEFFKLSKDDKLLHLKHLGKDILRVENEIEILKTKLKSTTHA